MASDLLGKIKETLVPSNTENSESYNSNSNTNNSFGSDTNNDASFNPGSSLNSNSYNDVTENSSNQREFGSTNRNAGLESTGNDFGSSNRESEFNRNAGLESTSDEFGSSNRTSGLESSNQTQQNEGGRTQRVRSLVENVPGVPETFTSSSSSTSTSQSKPTFDTPSYQNDMHHRHFDAARAPPSALREHLGEPSIEHDYPHESSTKRHSSVSHQEEHYNLN
ncbi:hypothetical protein LB507_005649 [Fusarium sp. FIESC RH6]|nr:hypothetical protein LB507_005649 [Fusarium sp. FIESC RH6]